jgi:hypothetical protein
MITADIQTEKLNLIARISQLQDISVIEKLKHILEDTTDVPQWQRDIVRERMQKSQEKPERLLDWDDVEDGFKLD